MKPISLEMRAFGPYGDQAEVDFEPLADVGLFVVSGPTGAGKSTIFDAICFALYGSLSGARANHNDVRSHYAEPAAKCTVVLVFDADGQRWRLTRQPSQVVQKQRGSGTTTQPATAVLERWTGDDWAPDSAKVREVTARSRELVGLSLEQFERVVLLPQGKFAEVLNAKTSERSELLRTLFGSEIFDRAARILGDQAKDGEQSLKGVNEQRAYFYERAVDAIGRVRHAIAALPAEMGVEINDAEIVSSNETQLSFLDALDEPAAIHDDASEGLGPAQELDQLVAGPIARLADLAERRRAAAESARTERDRAQAQRRTIDQRAETLRLLSLLDAQSDDMEQLAVRTAVGRKVLGLSAAIAERQSHREHLARVDDSMLQLWDQSRALVPRALPEVSEPEGSPSPSLVSDLLDQVAARSAALDLVAQERQRVDQLRREHASLIERVAHLDAIEERFQAEVSAAASEIAALSEEEASQQLVANGGPALDLRIAEHDRLILLRGQADAAKAELDQLEQKRSTAELAADKAEAAIRAAEVEIAALSELADEIDGRRSGAAQAKRRCERRIEFDVASGRLRDAAASAEAAKDNADAVFAAFVGQTAPRLAAQLIDDEPCPVCGSNEHPAPADVDHHIDGAVVDAAAVERASSAASAADAEHSHWRATVVALIEDDPHLAEADLAELQEANRRAEEALAEAERSAEAREALAAGQGQLRTHLVETKALVERVSGEVGRAQLLLRELEGALGEAAGCTGGELDEQRSALSIQRADADAATARLEWIKGRLQEIALASTEAERVSRQRSIDRATAAERIEQLAGSVAASEGQLADVLGGETLSSHREAVQSLRLALTSWQEQAVARASAAAAETASADGCAAIVAGAGFADEASALDATIPASTLEQSEASLGRWNHERTAHRAALATYEVQELPDEAPDLDALTAAALTAAELQREVEHAWAAVQQSVRSAQADLDEVAALDETHAHKRAEQETLQRVASVVRGQNSRRLSLENWVLSVYLHDVVQHANLHLATMSNGRYRLAVQDAPSNQVGQHGLDLVVDDAHTGRVRPSMSLSGGETFQASLALALGLADVVMLGRAGLHLDALFVDEGFGSLDADAIDQAITVLDGLRSRGSMVGVITHVEALKNALPVAIDVQPRGDHRGSQIRQVA